MSDRPLVDADAFTDRFFDIETKLALFEDRAVGHAWWDVVRYDVYRAVYAEVAGMSAQVAPRRRLAARATGYLQRLGLRIRFAWRSRVRRYDTLVLRAPRQIRKGQPADLALDELIPLCAGPRLVIDTYPHLHHLSLARGHGATGPLPPVVDRLIDALQSSYGLRDDTTIALAELMRTRLHAFDASLRSYRRLLARIRPRLVLLVQNGMEKALFRAAHEAGIPVVEAQHGLIAHAHPGYSYPPSAKIPDRSTFPDLFLTFSDYWSHACHYPADRCEAVGNDAFYPAPLPAHEGLGDILVVSADIYHDVLVRWIRPTAEALPERTFLYKLHPNQHTAFASIRAAFADLPNIQVIDSTVRAPSLFPQTSHVVLVQSTVLQEAAQAGRMVCVLPEMNYRMHRDAFDLPLVRVTPSVDALREALQAPVPRDAPPVYFAPFDRERAQALLRACVTDGPAAGGRRGP